MSHLLVTNDFPPKVGGIQSYLWELWRRLPPGEATVLTTRWPGAADFDAEQPMRVVRTRQRVLLPTPGLVRRIRALAAEVGAGLVVLDPALPLGLVGPRLGRPYAVVAHGAEVTVPGRLPLSRGVLARVLRGASGIIAAGGYPAAEAIRAAGGSDRIRAFVVPPGVDAERFRVLDAGQRADGRVRLGLPRQGPLVVSVSRLVPRKGMDVLIDAAALLAADHAGLVVAIAGTGRDRRRLARRVAARGAPVRLLGRLSDDALVDLYACGDVFAMLCRDRWAGLEQEGFGIVFLEAASSGVPQVAGNSGGAAEAVADESTGLVVAHPSNVAEVAAAIGRLLDDPAEAARFGSQGRVRAQAEFGFDGLAARLREALVEMERR